MPSEHHSHQDDRQGAITRILQSAEHDDTDRARNLLPLVYEELRALARARMAREGAGQTIQATALVHEAFIRLVGDVDPGWNGRAHFFGAAAQAMRRILVEQARRKGRLKHGGEHARIEMEHDFAVTDSADDDLLAVDDVLRKLEQQDARKGMIVNLRYFAGFTVEETAASMGLSAGTVEREWRFIKVWLRDELDRGGEG